jgi:hypothetical protein
MFVWAYHVVEPEDVEFDNLLDLCPLGLSTELSPRLSDLKVCQTYVHLGSAYR